MIFYRQAPDNESERRKQSGLHTRVDGIRFSNLKKNRLGPGQAHEQDAECHLREDTIHDGQGEGMRKLP